MIPIVVVETGPFRRHAAEVWSDSEREEFIDAIARDPQAGAIMQGTGGVRKLRWGRAGIGKSGGVRVIYYYHDEDAPIFLLTVYPKGQKDNLSKVEQNAIRQMATAIKWQIRQSRVRAP
jgi:hypothetical protein